MLPPLADYDDAENLMKQSIDVCYSPRALRGMLTVQQELDPFRVHKKGRHVMWGLLRVFSKLRKYRNARALIFVCRDGLDSHDYHHDC